VQLHRAGCVRSTIPTAREIGKWREIVVEVDVVIVIVIVIAIVGRDRGIQLVGVLVLVQVIYQGVQTPTTHRL